jgi:hypothetical protein
MVLRVLSVARLATAVRERRPLLLKMQSGGFSASQYKWRLLRIVKKRRRAVALSARQEAPDRDGAGKRSLGHTAAAYT